MSAQKLGELKIAVSLDEEGNLFANHETILEPALHEMQGAMSGAEKLVAVNIRRKACEAAGAFFEYLRNPDRD